jgi:hypothetical protein
MIKNKEKLGVQFVYLSFVFYFLFQNLKYFYLGLVESFSKVPFADSWNALSDLSKARNPFSIEYLWLPSNEHRLFLQRLLYSLNSKFFDGNELNLTLLHLLIVLITAGLLSFLYSRTLNQIRWSLFFLALMELTNFKFNSINLIWNYQLNFFLAILFPIIVFMFFEKFQRNQTYLNLFYLVVSLPILILINASGVIAIISLLSVLIFTNIRFLKKSLIATYAAFLVFLYISPVSQNQSFDLLSQATFTIQYFFIYLGSPFMHVFNLFDSEISSKDTTQSLLIGILFFCIFISLTYFSTIINFPSPSNFTILVLHLYLLLIPVFASVKRVDFGLTHAFAQSYLTFSGLMILSSVFLVFRFLFSIHFGPFKNFSSYALLLGIALILYQSQTTSSVIYDNFGFYKNKAALGLIFGVNDPKTMASIYPVDNKSTIPAEVTEWLMNNKSGYVENFYDKEYIWDVVREEFCAKGTSIKELIVHDKVGVIELEMQLPRNVSYNLVSVIAKNGRLGLVKFPNEFAKNENNYWGYLDPDEKETLQNILDCGN